MKNKIIFTAIVVLLMSVCVYAASKWKSTAAAQRFFDLTDSVLTDTSDAIYIGDYSDISMLTNMSGANTSTFTITVLGRDGNKAYVAIYDTTYTGSLTKLETYLKKADTNHLPGVNSIKIATSRLIHTSDSALTFNQCIFLE